MDIFSLKDKIAIVTGGATGLGLGITTEFVKAGAKVLAFGEMDYERVESDLLPFGDCVEYIKHDITDTEKTPSIVNEIISKYQRIDILFNNAGNHCKKPIEEMTVEDYFSVLNVHLIGAFALTKAVIPQMKKQKNGSILFQASMTSFIGQPEVAGYSTAKAGYLGLVHTLASECGSSGVRVNAIAPGWIDTPMFHKATDNDKPRFDKIMGRIPMKRVGTPKDIGMAAVFLSSEAAGYINGVCLPVDGGALIGF